MAKMTNYDSILIELKSELHQALFYLDYSYNKIIKNNFRIDQSKDPEVLETFEALTARFARVTDIFISKYLRAIAEKDDPAFRGGLRDWVNYAEKKGIVSSSDEWMELRELRNKIAHEYAAKELNELFNQILLKTPIVLGIKSIVK
jgi:hypothetical protein